MSLDPSVASQVTRDAPRTDAPPVLVLPVAHHLFHAPRVSFIYFFWPENLNFKKNRCSLSNLRIMYGKNGSKGSRRFGLDVVFSLVFFKVLNVEIRVRMQKLSPFYSSIMFFCKIRRNSYFS